MSTCGFSKSEIANAEVLDDADLQLMQGMITISDDEDEENDLAMSAFPRLQPMQGEIDLDPSQMVSHTDVCIDGDNDVDEA